MKVPETLQVECVQLGANAEDSPVRAGYVDVRLRRDGSAWCATKRDFVNLQESPCGFGDTPLEAIEGLCHELGYEPSRAWQKVFYKLGHEGST